MEKIFGNVYKQVLRGVITAVLITLACVLIFALLLDVTGMSESVIRPVNQFIKVLSVFAGTVLFVKGEKGWLKGLLIGLISSLLSSLLFGLISGGASFGLSMLIDVLFGAAMGVISGVISVNLPRRKF